MKTVIRDKLCPKCLQVILEYEREYRKKNRDKLKKYRHEFYIKQIGKNEVKVSEHYITDETKEKIKENLKSISYEEALV